MTGIAWLACAAVLCAGCSSMSATTQATATASTVALSGPTSTATATARIVLVGDVMLGRSVAPVAANDGDSIFEALRPRLADADLALANLESPLTTRPHLLGENALEADPSTAGLLASAGFDGVAIANNHAGDAGPETVADTIAAVSAAGLAVIGAGVDIEAATNPTVFERNGLRIAVLAFDLTRGGPSAGDGTGVATWDPAIAHLAVESARAAAEVVIVGLHGGVEYLVRPDPVLAGVVADLSAWGVDVIWGNGTHVPYAISIADGTNGRRSVQAPGLGNALFDQRAPRTGTGTMLEVTVGADGPLAWRTAAIGSYLRTTFDGWDLPSADAVAIGGEWWSPTGPVRLDEPATPTDEVGGMVDGSVVVVARIGDIDQDGSNEVIASYRRPFRPRILQGAFPDTDFVDASGRSAHLGVFAPDGPIRWGAGTMTRPVAALDVCGDGGIALGFSALDDPAVTAGGAWWWRGFGFITAPVLDGSVVAGCTDLDGDGRSAPALVRAEPDSTSDIESISATTGGP